MDVDTDGYKVATQLIFIFSIVTSLTFSPRHFKTQRAMFSVAATIALGLIVSIFMAGYAATTANCSAEAIANGTRAKLHLNNTLALNSTDDMAELKPLYELLEVTGGKSMAASFLALSTVIAVSSHDIFSKDRQLHVAISHWPSWMDMTFRLIG